jgi:hypothetical protein
MNAQALGRDGAFHRCRFDHTIHLDHEPLLSRWRCSSLAAGFAGKATAGLPRHNEREYLPPSICDENFNIERFIIFD